MRLWAACLAALLTLAAPLTAQPLSEGEPVIRSPILSINYDRFFAGSALGRQMVADLEAERIMLEADNRRIESELEAEEVDLTAARDEMLPEDFRAAASAFDEKVQKIRAERRQLALELTQKSDALRQQFDEAALPVLTRIVREAGAVVVVDSRSVVLTLDAIDITDLAIARLDAAPVSQTPSTPPQGGDAPQPPETQTPGEDEGGTRP